MPVDLAGITVLNRDFMADVAALPDASFDLILADPPYGLGKDYGNDSDKLGGAEHLAWTFQWLELAIPKLKPSGCLYIFCTWQYAPEIFSFLKTKLVMVNEIIWDPARAEHGGHHAAVYLGARQHRHVRVLEGLLLQPRPRCACPMTP